MANAREPNTVGFVKIVILAAVGPELASKQHLGKDRTARYGGDEVCVARLGMLADGSEEVGVKYAGEAGACSEEDESVGEGHEEGCNGGLERLVVCPLSSYGGIFYLEGLPSLLEVNLASDR